MWFLQFLSWNLWSASGFFSVFMLVCHCLTAAPYFSVASCRSCLGFKHSFCSCLIHSPHIKQKFSVSFFQNQAEEKVREKGTAVLERALAPLPPPVHCWCFFVFVFMSASFLPFFFFSISFPSHFPPLRIVGIRDTQCYNHFSAGLQISWVSHGTLLFHRDFALIFTSIKGGSKNHFMIFQRRKGLLYNCTFGSIPYQRCDRRPITASHCSRAFVTLGMCITPGALQRTITQTCPARPDGAEYFWVTRLCPCIPFSSFLAPWQCQANMLSTWYYHSCRMENVMLVSKYSEQSACLPRDRYVSRAMLSRRLLGAHPGRLHRVSHLQIVLGPAAAIC